MQKPLTFAEAAHHVRSLAAWLAAEGISRGDRVVLLLENRVEVPLLLFATAQLGALFVVMSEGLRAESVRRIVDHTDPKLLVTSRRTAALAKACSGVASRDVDTLGHLWTTRPELPPFPGIDLDPAGLVFTSGSTGEPRGAVLTHDNILFTASAIQRRLGYRTDDVIGLFLPLAFDYGLYQVFLATLAGAHLLLGDPREAGVALVPAVRDAQVTVLPVVPTLLGGLINLLSRKAQPLPALRAVTSTGEVLPQSMIQRLRVLLPHTEVFAMYGLTECKRVSILLPEEASQHRGSVGRPLDGTEVWAADAAGRRLGPGQTGELRVRGRHVTSGYWRNEAATARRFAVDRDSGARVLSTGDIGHIDAEGFVYVYGRQDALLKHRGYRISGHEIEAAALEVPGVTGAALVREESADELHLFVTADRDDRAGVMAALRVHLRDALDWYKVPERIHTVVEVPRTANGKVDRASLVPLRRAQVT